MDDELVDKVVNWIGNNDNKLDLVEKIIEYEDSNKCGQDCNYINEEGHDNSCWKPGKDISMSPYYIGAIKGAPFIETLLDTNNHTRVAVTDVKATREALNTVKDRPEEHSDEWVKQKVSESNKSIPEILSQVNLTKSDKEEIQQILDDEDALDYWYKFVAPDVKYRDNAKKAIMVMLASPEDKYNNKGRVNIKIYGPPGTGKSALKGWLRDNFGAETIDGPRVSKSDLTYDKNRDEMGLLPRAHKGILVIEEADEMGEDELGSTLTSLGEEGKVEIRDMEIPAATRGVMLSNFEDKRQILNEWSPESLNRFDFVIKFNLLDGEQKSNTLDHHYEYFRKPSPNDDNNIFKKYIKYVRQFNPELQEIDDIKEFKDNNINDIQNIREGISIMNVAWTIARLNLEDVELEHYKSAYRLVTSGNENLYQKFS